MPSLGDAVGRRGSVSRRESPPEADPETREDCGALYTEVNWHTGLRRLHTAASLRARADALSLDVSALLDGGQPVAGPHVYFRLPVPDDDRFPRAMQNGAWGRIGSSR